MRKFQYTIKEPNGLHARPAGLFVRCSQECSSDVNVSKDGKSANAKRLFSVMGLGVCKGDVITVSCEGSSEASDISKLKSFCEANI